jgi:hypothetical protein
MSEDEKKIIINENKKAKILNKAGVPSRMKSVRLMSGCTWQVPGETTKIIMRKISK